MTLLCGLPNFPRAECVDLPVLPDFLNFPHPLFGGPLSRKTPIVEGVSDHLIAPEMLRGVLFGSKARIHENLVPDGLTKEQHFKVGAGIIPPICKQVPLPHFLDHCVSESIRLGPDKVLEHRKQMMDHLESVFKHPWHEKHKEAWQNARLDRCREVNPNLDGPGLVYLLNLAGLPIEDLEEDLFSGFRYTGRFSEYGVWPPGEFPDPKSLDEVFGDPAGQLKMCVDRVSKQEEWLAVETWRATEKEIKMGILRGPFRARPEDTDLPELPVLSSEAPRRGFLPRFGVPHNSEKGRARPIDDGKVSGLNTAAVWGEHPWLPSLDVLIGVIQKWHQANKNAKMIKLDHASAYKKWAVREHDVALSTLVVYDPVKKRPVCFESGALVFGAIGSVAAYCNISMLLSVAVNRLLYIPQAGYVDDFVISDHEDLAESSYQCVVQLHEWLGIELKRSKDIPPTLEADLLGIPATINNENKTVTLQPTQERKDEVDQMLDEAIKERRITPKTASRLAGKTSFVAGSLWGRWSRTVMSVLWSYTMSAKPSKSIIPAGDVVMLKFLRHALATSPPPRVTHRRTVFGTGGNVDRRSVGTELERNRRDRNQSQRTK